MALPEYGVGEVLSACNRRVDAITRGQFEVSRVRFNEIESAYIEAGLNGRLASLTIDYASLRPSRQAMQELYRNRMVPETSSGRYIYDDIRTADGGVCAICGLREAGGVDHYLPKELFPALAFLPANLLPACSRCNGRKAQYTAATREVELLHPYFDKLASEQWVVADVVEGNPVPVYRVVEDPANPELSLRVGHHFARFRLADSYSMYAASELAVIRGILCRLYGSGGSRGAEVRAYLKIARGAVVSAASRNNWRAVAYGAWLESDWFVHGGYGYGDLDGVGLD